MSLIASEIGLRLAKADGIPEDDSDYSIRQVRNWTNLGFLDPVGRDGRGPKAPALFSESALYKARIFSVLSSLGFDATRIRQVNADLSRPSTKGLDEVPPSFMANGYFISQGVIGDALRGVEAGERWEYRIRLLIDADGHQLIESGPVWPDYPQGESKDEAVALAQEHGLKGFKPARTTLATVILDLNALFAPLKDQG